ncbi:MAG: ATPase, partial [Protaetiibacter sp.]
ALAAALDTPVAVGATAGEGGAWGAALLAAYRRAVIDGETLGLADWLDTAVFADAAVSTVRATASEVAGYAAHLAQWQAGLAIEQAAIAALSDTKERS